MQNFTPIEWTLIAIAVVAVLAAFAIGWSYSRRSRSEQLRRRFGPEYDLTVSEFGSRASAESELARRERRVRNVRLRDLTAEQRRHYAERWELINRRFVDEPGAALLEADNLLTDVMVLRGYPAGDFKARFDIVSSAYPRLASKYREVCGIVALERRNEATTEERRQAVMIYRGLFDHLVGKDETDEKLRRVS